MAGKLMNKRVLSGNDDENAMDRFETKPTGF